MGWEEWSSSKDCQMTWGGFEFAKRGRRRAEVWYDGKASSTMVDTWPLAWPPPTFSLTSMRTASCLSASTILPSSTIRLPFSCLISSLLVANCSQKGWQMWV